MYFDFQKMEVKEDRLSGKVVLNGSDDAVENSEANMSVENMDQCQGIGTTVDYADGDLCNCEDCKWKKKYSDLSFLYTEYRSDFLVTRDVTCCRDLSAEDLQEMMKLRRLGMDLRQYIRYTFNWFMESSGFSANSVKTPLPYTQNPPLHAESVESFAELRDSVAL